MSNPFQSEHAQCNNCGTFTRGPHAGETPEDHNVYAADAERLYTAEEAEAAGLSHNVSGTYCPDCFRSVLGNWKAEKAAREADRQAAQEAEQVHQQELKARRDERNAARAVEQAAQREARAEREKQRKRQEYQRNKGNRQERERTAPNQHAVKTKVQPTTNVPATLPTRSLTEEQAG